MEEKSRPRRSRSGWRSSRSRSRGGSASNDTLYGSVTSADIAQALKDKGFDIDKRKIRWPTRSRRSARSTCR